MKIAAIVPHLLPFGGIRRFLEVGNVMTARGHDYTLYARDAPVGSRIAGWMDYHGKFLGWEEAEFTIKADVVIIGDPSTLEVLEDPKVTISGKVYIWVIAAGIEYFLKQYKEYEAKGYNMLLNTRLYLDDFPTALICEGGVNTSTFTPKGLRVGYYAGRGSHKGEQHIVESLKGLKHIIPVAIRGLDTSELAKAYRSLDYFVCSETRAGWSNMAAEAIACGTTVVSDSKNTDLYSDRVINVKDLRAFFENPMGDFSWEKVCDRLTEIWNV
jgi:glycosyltransferase involved in cell wall biosynthesis